MIKNLIGALNSFMFLLGHPLNRDCKWSSIKRYLCWHLGSRMVPGDVLVPFVDKTFLRVHPGMTGATGNIYLGLHEFEDMAFVLHLLREKDLFVDIGANVGSYTVLAGGAVGAQCIAIEPIKGTFQRLEENINLNRLSGHVQTLNIGIGNEEGVLRFTAGLDTVNHVLSDSESVDDIVEVPIVALNDLLGDKNPLLIKIDVEGFETNVIAGAELVLSHPSLLAVIMELNGSGDRYDFDEQVLHEKMLSFGFNSYTYEPFERQLISLNGTKSSSGNTLYIRSVDEVSRRLISSQRYLVMNGLKSV